MTEAVPAGGASFRSSALVMVGGAAAAQLVPLLALPVVTRLYGPGAVGLQALFITLTTVAAVVATLRLDLATVLPERQERAYDIARAVLVVVGLVVTTLLLVAAVAGGRMSSLLGAPGGLWLWLLAPMVLGAALTQMGVAFATRSKDFRQIAVVGVVHQVVLATVAIGLGLASAPLEGLVVAKVCAQLVSVLLLRRSGFVRVSAWLAASSWVGARGAVVRYRQFVVFNTPYSLLGTVTRDAPVLLFAAMGSAAAVAYYALARTLTLAPATLVSAGLSQVFFREAVELRGTPALSALALRLLRLGAFGTLPLFAVLTVFGDVLFAVALGERWRPAGVFVMVLAPAFWLGLQAGWPERLYEVAEAQSVSFRIQVVSDSCIFAGLATVLAVTGDELVAMATFSVAIAVYYAVYLAGAYRVSRFPLRPLVTVLAGAVAAYGCSAGLLGLLRVSLGPDPSTLVLAVVLMGITVPGMLFLAGVLLGPLRRDDGK